MDRLILFAHQSESLTDLADYQLLQKNIEFVLLAKKKSSPNLLFTRRRFTRIIEIHSIDLDAFLVRGPTTLMPFIAESLRPIPMVFLMVGDHLAGLNSSKQAPWRKFLIKKFWQYIYKRIENNLPEVMVIANSEKLYEKYKKDACRIARTHTTSLSENDLWMRDDTCENHPIQLLFSGRIAEEKGIEDILEAICLLRNDQVQVNLNIVGWEEAGGQYSDHLLRLIDEKKLTESVKIIGYLAAGEALYQQYRNSDIFVLASKSSFEGFPRVLWEAMANCLPIVSTSVGSIPDYVGDFIDLVPPNDPKLLAEGIKKVLVDEDYRKSMIRKGFELAQDITLEKQTRQLVSLIKDYARASD